MVVTHALWRNGPMLRNGRPSNTRERDVCAELTDGDATMKAPITSRRTHTCNVTRWSRMVDIVLAMVGLIRVGMTLSSEFTACRAEDSRKRGYWIQYVTTPCDVEIPASSNNVHDTDPTASRASSRQHVRASPRARGAARWPRRCSDRSHLGRDAERSVSRAALSVRGSRVHVGASRRHGRRSKESTRLVRRDGGGRTVEDDERRTLVHA